jgi:hypothetical protein
MSKRAKFALADMDLDFIQIIADDGDLAKKLEKALKARIAKEFSEGGEPKRKRSSGKKKEAGDE